MTMNETTIRRAGRCAQRSVGLLLVAAALAGLVLGVGAYFEAKRATAADEDAIQMVGNLSEIVELDNLIRQIDSGQAAMARQTMSLRLRSALPDVQAALARLDPETRMFGQRICSLIAANHRQLPNRLPEKELAGPPGKNL